MIKRICKTCKKPFYVHSYVLKHNACKFCSRKCRFKDIGGSGNPKWKGGKMLIGGYWYILSPEHPSKTQMGYVAEHRLVMEKKIGRFLKKNEIIHHINGIKTDNRTKNLMITNNSEHTSIHFKGVKQTPEHIKKRIISRFG